jgi:hypothetical protein
MKSAAEPRAGSQDGALFHNWVVDSSLKRERRTPPFSWWLAFPSLALQACKRNRSLGKKMCR